MADRLLIEVSLTTGDTKAAFDKIEKDAKKSGQKSGKGFSAGFAKIGGIAAGLFGVTRAFSALNSAVRESTRAFRDFARTTAEVNSILPKNEKLLSSTTDQFRSFAALYATDSATQAKAFYNIVSAGVKGTEKQLRTLSVANDAATAGLVSIDESAKLLVSSVNAYSQSGLTATEASDALFVAVREGQTTFQELSNFLGNTTSIAASAGVGFEELAGSIAFITKAGIATDRAVIGIRQVLTSIIKPTKEAANEAKRLGIEFTTDAIRAKGFAGFLRDVAEKTKGSEKALAKLFGNVRALAPILAVVNGGFEEFVRIQKEVQNAAGATVEATAQIQKNADFQLSKLAKTFRILGEELVGPFVRSLALTAGEFSDFILLTRSSTSELDKVKIRLVQTQIQLDEYTKSLTASGTPALKEYSQSATFAQKKVFLLTEQLNELLETQRVLNQEFKNNEFLNNDLVGRSIVLKQELIGLQDQLNTLKTIDFENSMKAVDIGKSEFEILGMITAKQKELAMILETIEKIKKGKEPLFSDDEIASVLVALQIIQDLEDQVTKTAKKIAKALSAGIENTVINLTSRLGAQLKIGKAAWAEWEAGILDILGDLAISLGKTLIGIGIGIEKLKAALKSLSGGLAIAAGVALITLGGFLKATSATLTDSATTGGGGGGGGSTGGNTQSFLPEPEDIERQVGSEINITVEGSLVQQDELGKFISDVISESNEKNGNVIVNPRFA